MAKPLKTVLIKEARQSMSNPIAYCGHQCEFCNFKYCGGCRSEYVGNSYKKVCGGTCPNIVCAQEKGLDGCYLCDDLPDCQIGFYKKEEHGPTAKATALFIKKYGEECYTATLKKAMESGQKYAKSFDKTGSVKNAFALLESYL